jgi:hypothetical protein
MTSSDYPGRAPFQPGPSEYGATKSWTGSPMASLHRAVNMLSRLDLHKIPRQIRDALRQLQDAYSEGLDFGGSDTISQGSIDPGSPKESEEGSGGKIEEKKTEPRQKSNKLQQSGAEQMSADSVCGDEGQDDEVHIVTQRERRTHTPDNRDYLQANVDAAYSHPMLHHHDIDCNLESGNNSPRFWRWGPSATSDDAAEFFQRVM